MEKSPKKIYITGVSGAGKSTALEKLKEMGFPTIGIDETPNLTHWFNKKDRRIIKEKVVLDRKFIETHEWLCDATLLQRLLNAENNTVFVAGVAYNQELYLDYFDTIILLQIRPEVLIKRLVTRTTNDFGKETSAQEHVLNWQGVFDSEMLKKGAIPVDAEMPLENVIEQILGSI